MMRLALALLLAPMVLGAQRASRAPVAGPSRADSLLAVGRLWLAEQELYAAVDAQPRTPAARGALGDYLASRARFKIAEVLYDEALRFGASRSAVQLAKARMAPYRLTVGGGGERSAALEPVAEGSALGTIAVRVHHRGTGGAAAGGEATAAIDVAVAGVVVGRARAGLSRDVEVEIAGWRVRGVSVAVDSSLAPDAVKIGVDVLWALHPTFEPQARRIGLGAVPTLGPRARQIPFVLTFPGISLVPRPGVRPVSIASAQGRALLRGARWWVDAEQGVVVVE